MTPSPVDESMVGQFYLPHHDRHTLCVVGEIDRALLAGTHEIEPVIVRVHSPPFERHVKNGGVAQLIFVRDRQQRIFITHWDEDNLFGEDWSAALQERNRRWQELKDEYVDSLEGEQLQAYLRLQRAAEVAAQQIAGIPASRLAAATEAIRQQAATRPGFNPTKHR